MLCALGLVMTLFSVNIIMAGVGLFIALSGIQNCFNILFYYLTEQTSEDIRTNYSVIVQLFFGFGVLLNVLWAFAAGNWKVILTCFYLIPTLVSILGMIVIVRDTPICLVTRYSANNAYKGFKFIAKMNKK